MKVMKIIIGLGNPEETHAGTRHNAGFMVLDKIAKKFVCTGFRQQQKVLADVCKKDEYIFAKPSTYMNRSGQAVRALLDYYKADSQNLYLIHDDLDLELGSYKIQFGTGPQGHNGLLSVYQHLGNKNFWHVRVGVDSREGNRTIEPSNYVLQRFSENEQAVFESTVNKLVEDLYSHVQMSH